MGVFATFWVSLTFLFLFLLSVCSAIKTNPKLLGVVPAGDNVLAASTGVLRVVSSKQWKIRLLGYQLSNASHILFTRSKISCFDGQTTEKFPLTNVSEHSALFEASLDGAEVGYDVNLHICVYADDGGDLSGRNWIHQGDDPWVTVQVCQPKTSFLPLWIQISLCTVLLVFSGIFSGLNLGLMSLDQTELTIIQKVGSAKEKRHAKRIFPLRKKGNLLLCTLLLGNVMVNSTFTILFDDLTNGVIAIISSTVGIVIFGEIIPQAICSRHGLAVGARTYWITRFFMFVTFPCSFPISLILDKILGEEMGQVYNKEKLQELIQMTADQQVLHDNEANIMAGALQLTSKSVEDVMTKIEDVFMLELNTELDFQTLTDIMRHGYTRVPVYEKEITNIVNLLNTKDLALIDPDDKTQLGTVCRFYDHKPLYVDYDLKLNVMLQEFLQGNCHMAIVQKLHNTENKDPYYENIGVVTLEDVIEEILQSEIIDETDRMVDNRQKQPVAGRTTNYGMLPAESTNSKLSKQLEFVAFQFLFSNVEAFSENHLNRSVLKNLMKKNIVLNLNPTTPVTDRNYLFRKGQPCDHFVLILQGTVEVTIGNEDMSFESGPFCYFGVEAVNAMRRKSFQDLKRLKDYVPDFSVRAVSEIQYLSIKKHHYMAALRTSQMLRSQKFSMDENNLESQFNMELAKLTDKAGDKNDSNSRLGDFNFPTNLPLEALKCDDSPKKRSTSSLDRVLSLTRKHDSLTRMTRSGSDAKDRALDSSPEYESIERRRKHSVSSNTDHCDATSVASDREESSTKLESRPVLASQTSQPFTPLNRSDDMIADTSPGLLENAGSGGGGKGGLNFSIERTSNDGNPKSGMDTSSASNDNASLEKVPLVEIKRSHQRAGSDNPAMTTKFKSCHDEPEAVPLMQQQQCEKSKDNSKDGTSAPL